VISYIGVGSNQTDPFKQATLAIETLRHLPKSLFCKCSSLYHSAPMGPQDQPAYINAMVKIDTQLTAMELLDALQKIELSQGRVRKENRWGPRTLDLDIILYGNEVINNNRLTIPHYGMKAREFVLYPLFEIAKDLLLPDGQALSQLAQRCNKNGLVRISG